MQNVQNDILKGFSNVTVSTSEILPRVPAAFVVFIIGVIFIRIINKSSSRALRFTNWPIGLQEIMVTVIRVALWILLVIAILQVLGLTSVALAVTGSFAILLLGFSSGISHTVSDLVAGLQIANDKDFRVGYRVKAGDQKTEGIIRELDIKKTRIEDDKGHIHVIPNSVIEKNEWVVLERHVHSKMPSATSRLVQKAKSIKKGEK